MKRIISVISVFMLLLSAGCASVGPDYTTPEISLPAQWSVDMQSGLNAASPAIQDLAAWWSRLDNPVLTSLLERAVRNNTDLREARARIREARARRDISKADLFPTVDASGSRQWNRTGQPGGGFDSDSYSVGFDAGWELDIFGGVRRSVEASAADLDATEENMRDVLVTLLAEVALNYVDARTYQARLTLAKANLDTQQETYDLVLARSEVGLTSRLDVEQAKYNLESTRSKIPALETGLDQTKNRIAVLLGQNPGTLDSELSDVEPIPVAPIDLAIGVPADVLRQRPDVRRTERQLAAQTARIGVATADLYPKFRLSGTISYNSDSLDNLFRSGNHSYGIGPSFSWAIFNAGRIRQNIEVQNALQEQALIQYEASILAALEEVENALTAYVGEHIRLDALVEASQAAERAAYLAENQYFSGVVDFQTVLSSQRSLLSLQDQVASSKGEATSNMIRLYKTLGGGWTPLEPSDEIKGGLAH